MMYVIIAAIFFGSGTIFGVILMALMCAAGSEDRMREKLDNGICKEKTIDHI